MVLVGFFLFKLDFGGGFFSLAKFIRYCNCQHNIMVQLVVAIKLQTSNLGHLQQCQFHHF